MTPLDRPFRNVAPLRRRPRFTAILLAAALLPALLAAVEDQPLQPEPYFSRIAMAVARTLPRTHLERIPLDNETAAKALQVYLSILDYDRSYFLASDIAEFQQRAEKLDDELRKGDVDFAFHVFDIFKRRLQNRCDYVEAILKQGFDLSQDETFVWKRKDAEWPATEAAWNELWRKKIKNEYVGRVVAEKLAEEEAAKQAAAEKNGTKPEATVSTNKDAAATAPEPKLTTEEFILKRYRQHLMVINDTDAEWVLQNYLTSFAQACDPHSDFMSASNTEDFDISMKLSLVGIGALLTSEDGAAKIVNIIPASPAARDGRLKAGDKIIAVAEGDGPPVDVLHWPLTKTVRLIRGKIGTKVTLTVIPAGDVAGARTVKLALVRDEIKLEEQAAKSEVKEVKDDKGNVHRVGLIRLPAFYVDMHGKTSENGDYRSSARDMRKILTDLTATNVEGVVLDLRNNGGGSLTEAVEMTGLFIDAGPIVQVKEGRGVRVLSDPDPSVVFTGTVAVLVNRQSASASEILAAALQDYGRAVIIGDSKTHGKGTVQQLMMLDENDPKMGSLKVTTASFHRITGGSTQLKGVRSDIVLPSALESLDIGEEFLPYPLPWTTVGDALYRPVTDLQPLIAKLRERSVERCAKDARYTARLELLKRLDDTYRNKEISLKLDERLKLARVEKSLEEVQHEDEDPQDGVPKDEKEDLILHEALAILADMGSLSR